MIHSLRFILFAGVVFVAPVLIGNCAKADPPASKANAVSTQPPATRTEPASTQTGSIVLTDAERQGIAVFDARVADYATLHHRLEATIPPLPDRATPEQIDEHQRALAALITTARAGAKPGELFTPGMEALVRRTLGALAGGPGGTSFTATIMDDNPGALDISVNDPYPDAAPVSSMPVQLLETLPKLPAELEYRFLGKHLVLVCTPARIVLDLTPNVLP